MAATWIHAVTRIVDTHKVVHEIQQLSCWHVWMQEGRPCDVEGTLTLFDTFMAIMTREQKGSSECGGGGRSLAVGEQGGVYRSATAS